MKIFQIKKIVLCIAVLPAIAAISSPVWAYHSRTEMTLNVLVNKTGCEIAVDRIPDADNDQYVKIWNCAKGGRNEMLFHKEVFPNSSFWLANPYFESGSIDGKLYVICGFYWDGGKNHYSRFPPVVTRSLLVLTALLTGGLLWLAFVRKTAKTRKRIVSPFDVESR